MGHTTQALPNKKNPTESDRTLSAMRSAIVTAYLQDKNVIAASKLVSLGYGQNHPIASFKTEKDRSLNRRVEFMISKTGGSVMSLDDYYSMFFDQSGQEDDSE
jgi:chemotaxis protein MotB